MKQFFEKSSLFGKNWEKPFEREHDCFEGKGASGDKNQYDSFFFCRKRGFEYSSFKNFLKKIYFPK